MGFYLHRGCGIYDKAFRRFKTRRYEVPAVEISREVLLSRLRLLGEEPAQRCRSSASLREGEVRHLVASIACEELDVRSISTYSQWSFK